MMKIYTLFTALMLFVFTAEAQQDNTSNILLYHENFDGALTGLSVGAAGHWQKNNSPASNSEQASGASHVVTSSDHANSTATKILYLSGLNTAEYYDLGLTWTNYASGSDIKPTVRLYYSVDNGPYSEVTDWQRSTTINTAWNQVNGGAYIALPANAASADLRLAWTVVTSGVGAYYGMDDITVVGTPASGISRFDWSSRPHGENPFEATAKPSRAYTVDGIQMKWLSQIFGTTLSALGVDTYYNGPDESFRIQQEFADGAAHYSVIELQLSEPVLDFTFTLSDVDRHLNQFRDKLEIVAYAAGRVVNMDAKKVKVTAKNEFRGSNIVSGIEQGADAVAAQADGNIRISYGEYIDRIVITYYNEEPTRNANGIQGISIRDLSWRNEQIAPLPVELISFDGAVRGMESALSWTTAQEVNNDKFVVERSQDGKVFAAIGEIKGHGNSSARLNYSFTDTNPAAGTNYYRLRQVDLDGTEDFSVIIALEFYRGQNAQAAKSMAKVYPTMATSKVKIRLVQASAQVTITDANGRLVRNYIMKGRNITVPVQHLSKGVYFVTIVKGDKRETQRFVKR